MSLLYRATDLDIQERFWKKVDKNGPIPLFNPDFGNCWLWTAAKTHFGYGQLRVDGKTEYAHVIAMIQAARMLPDGKHTLHTCDVPNCVRNDTIGIYVVNGIECVRYGHLFQGNDLLNQQDKFQKGKFLGDNHWNTKISEENLQEVFELHKKGWYGTDIARKFGVDQSTISLILKGKRRMG